MRRCLGCMTEYAGESMLCPECGHDQNTPAKEPFCLEPGTILQKRYIVGQMIAYDGFEVKYIAYDALVERKAFIIEYLPMSYSDRTQGVLTMTVPAGILDNRFAEGLKIYMEGAEQLAQFNSLACLPSIYDSFYANDTGYVVSEYLTGDSITAIMGDEYVLSFEQAREITIRVLLALKSVHAAGVTHCNITPDSVFISEEGEVKLLAFGLARQALREGIKQGELLTPGYAALEQYGGQTPYGPRSDVYSVAAVFYFMLTGITPPDALARRKNDTLRPPSRIGAALPKKAEAAIMSALSLSSSDRMKSAADFEAALSAGGADRMTRLPGWLKASIVAACVILIAAVVLVLFKPFAGDDDESIESPFPIPLVESMSEAKARAKLDELGLTVTDEDVTYIASDTVAVGDVISQSPEAGSSVSPGETVTLVVSSGKENNGSQDMVAVSDVIGKSESDARGILVENGFKVTITNENSDTVESGNVIGQSPVAGTPLKKGEEIQLIISSGPKTQQDSNNDDVVVSPNITPDVDVTPTDVPEPSASVDVTSPVQVTGVTLNQTNITMTEGATRQIVATVSPADAGDTTVRWSSSDQSVASVSSGSVTAVKEGRATITVTTSTGGFTARCEVTVTPAVTDIKISPSTLTLTIGDNESSILTATVYPENAPDTSVTWTSDDPDIATVTIDGVVTAITKGKTTIIATSKANNLITGKCDVTVDEVVTYTVSFNANGGSPAPPSQTVSNGELFILPSAPVKSYTVTFDSAGGSAVNPMSVNCEFIGWYTDASGGSEVSEPYSLTEDIILFARYEDPTLSSLPPGPTWGTSNFTGWYTTSNGGDVVTVGVTITGDTTYYARWTASMS